VEVNSLDGLSACWEFVNHRHIQVAIQSHRQSPRNRSSGHHKHVWRNAVLTPQFRPLLYTKAMLFINDSQSEVIKLNRIFNQRMRTYKNMEAPVQQSFVDTLAILFLCRTR